MTPNEEAEKLADCITAAIESVGQSRQLLQELVAVEKYQIAIASLRQELAERDEELKRLREAATAACAYLIVSTDSTDHEVANDLRAAIQPKEPNNETR